MSTYYFHYEWRVKGKIKGENTIKFSATSDDDARARATKYLKDFQESHPNSDIQYFRRRLLKEIRTIKEI
jgi:hypothetical protein